MQKLFLRTRILFLKCQSLGLGILFSLTKQRWFFEQKIKIGIVLLSLMNTTIGSNAQNNDTSTIKKTLFSTTSTPQQNPEVFCYVTEEMPQFPGNDIAVYLKQNLVYPQKAWQEGISGRVITQFVVDTLGNITDVQVVRGIRPDLDAEAIRVVSAMPKWIPGKQHNKVVRVKYTLPVNFQLPTGDSEENPSEPYIPPFFTAGNLTTYISTHLIYPKKGLKKKVEGQVITQFWINKDGSVSDVKVIQSLIPEFDAEAIRVVSILPPWQPARQRNTILRCKYTLPVTFKLPAEIK